LGPKGLSVVEAAINENPDVPGFVRMFHPTFPVGIVDHTTAGGYMQFSPVVRSYVPYMLFIDRKGVIRAQYTGSDPFLMNEVEQEKNIRAEAEKLLNDPAATPRKRLVKK
jgi:hypothetical protein